jgi:antitoxin ParD1/3/4
MNVALTPELEEFVQTQVAQGSYTSASEVIQDSLRLLQEHLNQSTQAHLKAEIQKGVDDIRQGRYTTYTNAQDLANHIKALGRQHQASES